WPLLSNPRSPRSDWAATWAAVRRPRAGAGVRGLWRFAPLWQSGRRRFFWSPIVVDPDGFRPNVGIVLMHEDGRLFWARRVNRDGWQFPQGGMNTDETPLEAMYRELREETGLGPEHVEVLGSTPGWLRYRLPRRCVRRGNRPVCIGQKQV